MLIIDSFKYSLRICYVPSVVVSAKEAVVYNPVKPQFSQGRTNNLKVSKHITDIISGSK